MSTLSGRIKNMLFPLAICTVVIAASDTGFASASGEGAHHVDNAAQLKDFGWRVFNFAVLAGIIGYVIVKLKVKYALSERKAQIERSLQAALNARDSAEAKLRDYSLKLDQASGELAEMRAAIIREAEQEKQRIIAHAHKAAEKIALQASLSAEQEILKARMALKAEAAQLAVDLAAAKLSGAIRKEDHNRYIGEYLNKAGQP